MSLQNSFNKIRRSAGIKKCVMIDGNVGDVYLDEKNKIVTLREYLEAMFKDMDYPDIVYWDRVEGATGAIDKLTLTDEVEVEDEDVVCNRALGFTCLSDLHREDSLGDFPLCNLFPEVRPHML